MTGHGHRKAFRAIAGSLAIGAMVCAATPASAQGIFETIFGGLRHIVRQAPSLPADLHAFADPFGGTRETVTQQSEAGPAMAYCVRTCDGHFFPVQAHAGVSAAEVCHAFCPASETKLYSGDGIDHAVTGDGSRYADMSNAFVYRQHLVAGCTCNGKTAYGLAPVDVATDPTLHAGDIVATKTGFTAYTGTRNKTAEFTPIQSYPGLPQTTRAKLAQTRIMPPNPGAPHLMPAKLPLAATKQRDDKRSASLAR